MYALENKEELSRDDMIENINDDISQYKAEGNYFKVLKRMFNVYSMNSNVSQMELLMKIFNSSLGKLYQTICILQAVEILHSNYKDAKTDERIKKCLALMNESTNIKTIHKSIPSYNTKLNKEAKNIYKQIMTDGRFQ